MFETLMVIIEWKYDDKNGFCKRPFLGSGALRICEIHLLIPIIGNFGPANVREGLKWLFETLMMVIE